MATIYRCDRCQKAVQVLRVLTFAEKHLPESIQHALGGLGLRQAYPSGAIELCTDCEAAVRDFITRAPLVAKELERPG